MRAAWLLLACALAGCGTERDRLTLATLTEEPAPSIAETVKTTLEARGLEIAITSADDASALLERVTDGDADIAIIEEPYETVSGLTTVAPLYPSVLHVLVRRDEKAATLAGILAGKEIWAGPPGGSAYRLLVRLATDAGLAADEYTILDNPWTSEPDVHFILGGLLDRANARLLSAYRLFSFRRSTDIAGGSLADAVALRHHDVKPFLLPTGTYPALADDAVLTLSLRSVLVARQGLDEQLVFDIAGALFAHAQDIAKSYPLVTRELDETLRSADLMLPLHPGARRFIDREGPGFIERYAEVLALTFTITVTLLSGAIALYRYRTQVRKDRVDHYYAKLLEIREALPTLGRSSSRQRVLDVQREVLDLLIDERVAADASLLAFISLSNQMLDELDARR
ncbi:MAG: TAXI family TRAP transporter solute-binding subunit [Pseudomonadota bacterium]